MISCNAAVHPQFSLFQFMFLKYSFQHLAIFIPEPYPKIFFFSKSSFQHKAQKKKFWPLFTEEEMGSFPHFSSGKRHSIGPRNFFRHLVTWPAGYVLCRFPSQRETHFILTLFLHSSQPHYHRTVLCAFGSSPRMLDWKQKETTLILWFPEKTRAL